jgi:hypothetical protein
MLNVWTSTLRASVRTVPVEQSRIKNHRWCCRGTNVLQRNTQLVLPETKNEDDCCLKPGLNAGLVAEVALIGVSGNESIAESDEHIIDLRGSESKAVR